MASETFFHRVGKHYHKHFGDISNRSRERLFISSISFFLTFLIIRAITYLIHEGIGPFNNMSVGGRHIHHLVWGILLLLIVGYLWLLRVGSGMNRTSRAMSRLTALLYGVGAALTLDEFALWLNLQDVYWEHEGRKSVDVVLLFGGLLSVGIWGRGFFHAVAKEFWRIFSRKR